MFLTPEELRAAERRRKDFDDLQLEISGFTGGTIPRFLRKDDIDQIREASGRGHPDQTDDFWRRYTSMTDDIARRLANTDQAIDRALAKSQARLQAAQEALQDIRTRATVTEDGRLVYRTQDQQHAFADDGAELSRNEMAAVQWRDDAPTWEQRQAAEQRLTTAAAEHESIQAAKHRTDYYHDRLQSGDRLSMDELKGIQTDLVAMPKAVRDELEQDKAAPPVHPEDRADTPDLLAGFTLAASDIAAIRRDAPAAGERPAFSAPAPR